ncbi:MULTISPECIES: alpha/beta fold hydrolase [Halocynthiibacter]|uniref:Alpha/beta hydrolase n=1 Tax=Halocynthiibacter halioticoli TaxID=2986804 RepID=A0AAE3LRS2_9RHOB|nr:MULTISPECIES: alpha/beta hydrolase [Halocynthiibacter]MCV6825867.1 alpha/beta hydrolase [Halocynthiibacter halioticoli]MCW4058868.1 alpha/beta hydrolase [Halocynthiibacter sp. SDUM655004]
MVFAVFLLIVVLITVPIVLERQRQPITRAMRAEAPGRFATLSNGVTHYQWAGTSSGRHVVCIHGLTTPAFVWTALVKAFALMGFRVLTYDLYGRGFSARPEGEQNAEFFRTQLRELIEDQKVDDDVILVGYSMGGMIATDYAANFPDKVERIILVASAGLGQRIKPLVRLMIHIPVVGDGLMYTFGGVLFGNFEAPLAAAQEAKPELKPWNLPRAQGQGYLPAVLSSYRHMLSQDQLDLHRKIAEHKVPVLAIWAEDDSTIPLSAMGRLAEVNREARQDVIADAGHGLPYTNSKDIVPIVQEYLRNVV